MFILEQKKYIQKQTATSLGYILAKNLGKRLLFPTTSEKLISLP